MTPITEQIAQLNNPQEFVRLCNMVFTAIYGDSYQVIDGTRSDDGNDGYVKGEARIFAIYCPVKPEARTDKDLLRKATSDLDKAVALRNSERLPIRQWTFVTPRPMSNEVLLRIQEAGRAVGLETNHQGSEFLANALLERKHLIADFPWLHVSQMEEFIREAMLRMESARATGAASEVLPASVSLAGFQDQSEKKAEKDGSDDLGEVWKLRQDLDVARAKPGLRALLYRTTDSTAQINAILGLLDLFNAADDSVDEFIGLCEEGVRISKKKELAGVEAIFESKKAHLLSQKLGFLEIEHLMSVRMDDAVGLALFTPEQRAKSAEVIRTVLRNRSLAFQRGIELAAKANNAQSMGWVLINIGASAGLRAGYLEGIGEKEQAAVERKVCMTAHLQAKELFSDAGSEYGVVNALYSLANQLRFLGEIDEAKSLNKVVLDAAKAHDDHSLLQKATWLQESLDTGVIPNYAAGERRKPMKR